MDSLTNQFYLTNLLCSKHDSDKKPNSGFTQPKEKESKGFPLIDSASINSNFISNFNHLVCNTK